jgi:hypothetical protein
LQNIGSAAADLSGWTVLDMQQKQQGDGDDENLSADRGAAGPVDASGGSWQFPSGTVLPAGGFMVVLCPRANGKKFNGAG